MLSRHNKMDCGELVSNDVMYRTVLVKFAAPNNFEFAGHKDERKLVISSL